MLTAGDEFPIHQTPEPIAFSGSDRNFYDRYFFNGYNADGSVFFAAAMGIYPHLNVIDAAVSVLRNGKQSSVYFYRPLNMERMDTHVGGFSVEVLEPLKRVRLNVEDTEGIALDVEFSGRSFPIEEPRFTHRRGSRMIMDVTRMTQNGHWTGALRIDGEEIGIDPQSWQGTRDRSWGVRPIGAPDVQPAIPARLPQFYWIWTPVNFPNLSMFFHVNDEENGEAWNTRAVLASDGSGRDEHIHLRQPRMNVTFAPGTRRMKSAILQVLDPSDREHKVVFEPAGTFMMKGIGYGHPIWRHGGHHGESLTCGREDFVPAELSWKSPEDLHIQEIVRARHEGPGGQGSDGVGVFEQMFIGPHRPSGFKEMLDGAA